MATKSLYPRVDILTIMQRMSAVMACLHHSDEGDDRQYIQEYKMYMRTHKLTTPDILYDTFRAAIHDILQYFDDKQLEGKEADAFRHAVIPRLEAIVLNAISAFAKLEQLLVGGNYVEYFSGGFTGADLPQLMPPDPATGYGYCLQREMYFQGIAKMYTNWLDWLSYNVRQLEDQNVWVNTDGNPDASTSDGKTPSDVDTIRGHHFEAWIHDVLRGTFDVSVGQDGHIGGTWNGHQWYEVGSAFITPNGMNSPGTTSTYEAAGDTTVTSYVDYSSFENASWFDRNAILEQYVPTDLATLEVDASQVVIPKPIGQENGMTVAAALQPSAWADLAKNFGTLLESSGVGGLGSGGWTYPSGSQAGQFGTPGQTNIPPFIPVTTAGDTTPQNLADWLAQHGISEPRMSAAWSDKRPDQFPEPHNVGDLAREMVRKQGGRNHLLLITHFGASDQNNWLVTIPDVGNNNFTQDPGDPGQQPTGGSASANSLEPGNLNLSATADATSTAAAGGASLSDGNLNNMDNARIELGGSLSGYGLFVAEAIQQYCTSTLPSSSAAAFGSSTLSASSGGAADLLTGSIADTTAQVPGGVARSAENTLAGPTGPATSPQHPASLWLAGHGLGGMVAQNLAAAKPFPGDNPGLAPAHVVKGVIALGAPIVGAMAQGVAYSLFRMPGDRIGDIPVGSVGVNDARLRSVHELKNPFLSPPWQSRDASAPDYVKDPQDPATVHTAYADSPELDQAALPFNLRQLGAGGGWGPTYVIPIAHNPAETMPLSSDTSSSGMPTGEPGIALSAVPGLSTGGTGIGGAQ